METPPVFRRETAASSVSSVVLFHGQRPENGTVVTSNKQRGRRPALNTPLAPTDNRPDGVRHDRNAASRRCAFAARRYYANSRAPSSAPLPRWSSRCRRRRHSRDHRGASFKKPPRRPCSAGLVGMAGKDDLVELPRPVSEIAPDDERVAMAVGDNPPGCNRVDDTAAVHGVEIRAFARAPP